MLFDIRILSLTYPQLVLSLAQLTALLGAELKRDLFLCVRSIMGRRVSLAQAYSWTDPCGQGVPK